jgi:hypothetical protein
VEDAVEHHITGGNEPLEGAGLVAFTPCGHWWVYPTHATPEQMHDLARFNLGIACSFCLAEWQASTRAYEPGTAMRIN